MNVVGFDVGKDHLDGALVNRSAIAKLSTSPNFRQLVSSQMSVAA
jgi:hypothetical protein